MSAIVVAQSENRVIGKSNSIPWYLPADLKHFREITTGHAVVMGRNTFESIIDRLGKPLPDRRNIIISQTMSSAPTGCELFGSLELLKDAIDLTSDDVFIIGGGQLYEAVMSQNLADKIYLTQIHASIDGDIFFPPISPDQWREVSKVSFKKDAKNSYDFDFIELRRI